MEPTTPVPTDIDAAVLARFNGFPRFGPGTGLHRAGHLLRQLPAPGWLAGLDAIKVTGSKGKGTVSTICAAILRELDHRTGLYTSPHLLRLNERVQIDGVQIPSTRLLACLDWVVELRDHYERGFPGDSISCFEAMTAAALRYFGDEQVPVLVAEVGIGGRTDPTRWIPGAVAVLTSVELEHTDILGTTTEAIAFNKCDLCPAGGTLIVGRVEPELLRRIQAYCEVRAVQVVDGTRAAAVRELRFEGGRMRFTMRCGDIVFPDLDTTLYGAHQAENIALATLAVMTWLARNQPEGIRTPALVAAVQRAVHTASWPGRLEIVDSDPETLIDIAHTPASARMVVHTLERLYPDRPVLLVVGIGAAKQMAGMLAELVPAAAGIICTRAYYTGSYQQARPVDELAAACETIRAGVVRHRAETLEEAVDVGRRIARAERGVLAIVGSVSVAIEAREYLRGRDPRALCFF